MRSEDITITRRNGGLSMDGGSPAQLGIDASIKCERMLFSTAELRLTVWFVGELPPVLRVSVGREIIHWLKAYRQPARTS